MLKANNWTLDRPAQMHTHGKNLKNNKKRVKNTKHSAIRFSELYQAVGPLHLDFETICSRKQYCTGMKLLLNIELSSQQILGVYCVC